MNTPYRQTLRVVKPEITMAPLVDIIFLLLIFFMVTTVFPEKLITIDKPEVRNNTSIDQQHIPVAIDDSGRIFLRDQAVDLQQLERRLSVEAGRGPAPMLVVFADKRATTDSLIKVIDTARSAGIEQFGIATDDAPH